MTTKLIAANFGLVLEIEKDGKVEKVQFSAVCPSKENFQPFIVLGKMCGIFNEMFGTSYYVGTRENSNHVMVPIAKPKQLKPQKKISQAQYNKRVKELVPQVVDTHASDTESK